MCYRYGMVPRYTSGPEAWQDQPPNTLVGIVCRVKSIKRDAQTDNPAQGRKGGYYLVLYDANHDEDVVTGLVSPMLQRIARKAIKTGERKIAFGAYDGEGDFQVADLRPVTRPTTMLGITRAELAEIDAKLDDLMRTPGGIRAFLLKELRELNGVTPEHLSPRFQLCEEMMLVVGLAHGQVERKLNSKPSVFMYSGPGTGKTTLASYVQDLLPFTDRVQPTIVTPAGFAASVEVASGGHTAKLGLVARCSGGAIIFDDMHRVEKRYLNTLQGIIMTVLEEGKVRMVKAGAATYDARCALVMTSNRLSMRNGKAVMERDFGPQEKGNDAVMPFDVLSRTDMVVNVGPGDDAVRSAMKIVNMEPQHEYDPEEDEDMESRPEPGRDEARRRMLQLLVARLKERIPLVDTSKIGEEAEDTMEELGLLMREYTAKIKGLDQESYDGDVLIRRMANTVRKILGALARLAGRDFSMVEDLDLVWDILIPKLEVVQWMCGPDVQLRPLGTREQQIKRALWASEQRFQQMMALFGGKKVSAEELARALGCAEVTVRRDLGRRRIQPEGNDYPIPYSSEWTQDEDRDSVITPEVAQPVMEMKEVQGEERERYPKRDCIERPPQEVKKPVGLLEFAEGGALQRAQRSLVGLIVDPEPQPYNKDMLAGFVANTSRKSAEMNEIPHAWEHIYLERWLKVDDWEERAMRALSVYAEGLGVGKDRWWILDGMEELQAQVNQRVEERGPLPDRIAQGIGALYTRMLYFREKEEEMYRKRLRT